jgi:hypothetical protein
VFALSIIDDWKSFAIVGFPRVKSALITFAQKYDISKLNLLLNCYLFSNNGKRLGKLFVNLV